jgi:hypothetical protein
MANYGVKVTQQDGNLGLQPGSNSNTMLVMGCALSGIVGVIYSFGDQVSATNTLVGGELLEAVQECLKKAPGSTITAIPINPSTQGGVGSVTHTGSGAMTVTPSLAPQGTITITCTTAGAIATAAFKFGVTNPITGVTTTSAPVTSVSAWTSTGYLVPGTYTTVIFSAGSYDSSTPDVYIISTLGVVTHPTGTGPSSPTFTTSPVDFYRVLLTVTKGGAVATSQITYSLDNGGSTSAVLTTAASYAIPNTGIVIALSGIANATDTYSFSAAPPTFSNTDLTNGGLTPIETTLLAQQTESLIWVVGSVASAAAWATQVALLESAAVTLEGSNIFVRFIVGGPTVGTVLQNAGSITVDSADTDSVVITARAGMSAPHVCVCAGDGYLTSGFSGLQLRRNASWAAAPRAVGNAASQDIGAREDGGLVNWTAIRDDFANGESFWSAGITSLQTDGPGPVFINQGLMGTVSTSDYYTLTNARVVDRASRAGAAYLKRYQLKKLPTQTRGTTTGTIREDAAVEIETGTKQAMKSQLVDGQPQDAVAVSASTVRTNSLYSTQTLIVNGAVQPFAYPTAINFTVGVTVQAS